MKYSKLLLILSLAMIGYTLVVTQAFAAVETEQDVLRILNRVVDWMFTFLLVISVIFVIIAAYNYLFAAGDAEKVKKAHLMIVYAVVAIAVGLLARGVSFIVGQLIEQPTAPTQNVAPPPYAPNQRY